MTGKILLVFSCNAEIARHFINKTRDFPGEKSALLLAKQQLSLQPMLAEAGIVDVYSLPEEFYGQMTKTETREVLQRIRRANFPIACYPLGDFGGNIVLLLTPVVENITAINVTSLQSVQQDISDELIPVPASAIVPQAYPIQQDIISRLIQYQDKITTLWSGNRSGEKPTMGLINNYPYDSEVLAHYVYAVTQAQGQVREIGCGIGYGAYLMSRINPGLTIEAIDQDAEVIALAQEMWGDSPGLKFRLADAHTLPWKSASADTVISFDVIEHVQKPDDYLVEIRRVLKDTGRFIGSTPNSGLFPYRVNLEQHTFYHELRRDGVWPWHIQYFNEEILLSVLTHQGFKRISINYPTFVDGINLYNTIHNTRLVKTDVGDFSILDELRWDVDSFAMTECYINGFSGYSFIFTATGSGE